MLVLFVLLMGRTEISVSPFFVRMPGWQSVVGWLFLIVGIGFLFNDVRQQSYKKGIEDGIQYVKEEIEDYLKGKDEVNCGEYKV